MTYVAPTVLRLYDLYHLMLWLCRHHSHGAGPVPLKDRILSKRQRDHLKLVLRAQWHGFDRNETIYLLKLFDETQATARD
ncbi:hypothetical protein [Roseobacter sp. CCS2]|uniref:hypothetical protein n=1 Tax=Roseobacter sp. CCS2 TaxID=391593 RepID=UPI0000F3E5D1|nr:hypothetical protein [Roseobacter sp. CCS2]EBA11985.1 hypothetical protein RCCS2_11849 [Roseobacter sp. CCS2]